MNEVVKYDKKDDKTVNKYVHSLREIASEIKHPLSDKEMASVFVDRFKYPFHEKIIGISSLIFYDLVTIGKMVKIGIKLGRLIESPPNAAKVENPS